MELGGSLTERGDLPVGRYCPIERVLGTVGNRSSMVLLREAMYGATRFEELAARSGLTETTTARKLRDLVTAGLLVKRPYREPGQRRRDEYVLTDAGTDLMPALMALLQWGNAHDTAAVPSGVAPRGLRRARRGRGAVRGRPPGRARRPGGEHGRAVRTPGSPAGGRGGRTAASGATTGGMTKAPGQPGAFVPPCWRGQRRVVLMENLSTLNLAGLPPVETISKPKQIWPSVARDPTQAAGDEPVEVLLDADGAAPSGATWAGTSGCGCHRSPRPSRCGHSGARSGRQPDPRGSGGSCRSRS